VLSALGWLAASTPARAQAPAPPVASPTAAAEPTSDVTTSIELFREGRTLLAEGRSEEACAKFRESLALRRSPGTLLNVGNCLEASGDLTGAFSIFDETLSLARAEPDPQKSEVWSSAARAELDALGPRIPRLVVAPLSEPGASVALDGAAFSAFGVEQRLNPGHHRLVATRTGRSPLEHEFDLVERQQLVITLPSLAPAPGAEPVAVLTPPPAPSQRARAEAASESTIVPWTIVGVGGAVLVAGAITGVVAANQASDLKRECPDHLCPDDLSAPESAQRTALTADVLMAIGLVGVAAGATWLLWPEEDAAPSVTAACGPRGCSATLRGHFF
jgi:hypothetical protein